MGLDRAVVNRGKQRETTQRDTSSASIGKRNVPDVEELIP